MENFSKRRVKLLKELPDHSLVVLCSNSELKQSEDATYPYFTNRNFYYLSNISQANSVLVLFKNKKVTEALFIDEFDATKEKWFGRKLTVDEAKSLSNIKNVFVHKDLINFVKKSLKGIKNVYFDLNNNNDSSLNDVKELVKAYKPNDIYPFIAKLRVSKDELELDNIVKAIHITDLGLKRVIKEVKKAKYEYEVYNAFNHEILNHGTHEIGFPSIIASGVHTCCLHYPTPYDKLDRSGLLLCDVGAGYSHYSSDITRTYPVNGKFNAFQKKVYQIVLNCNKAVIKEIRPGLTLKDLQNFAKEFLTKECLKAKLIKKPEDIINYYFHSVSHSLGLDTHDIGGRELTLVPGMILTVEPGLYIKEKKTGVRIEDDVLVTKTGSKCLSHFIPKEIKDIENLFKGK